MRHTAKTKIIVLLVLCIGALADGQVPDERMSNAQAYLALMLTSQFSEGVESTLIDSGVDPEDVATTIEDYFAAYAGCYIDALKAIDDVRATKMLTALEDGSSEEQIGQIMGADKGAENSDNFLERLRIDLRECALRIHQEFDIPVR